MSQLQSAEQTALTEKLRASLDAAIASCGTVVTAVEWIGDQRYCYEHHNRLGRPWPCEIDEMRIEISTLTESFLSKLTNAAGEAKDGGGVRLPNRRGKFRPQSVEVKSNCSAGFKTIPRRGAEPVLMLIAYHDFWIRCIPLELDGETRNSNDDEMRLFPKNQTGVG